MEKLLEVKNLVTEFVTDGKRFKALDKVSFFLKPGELIGVVGESGSGKSVTMKSLLQLITAPGEVTGGEVYLAEDGKNLLDYAYNGPEMRKIRGGKISMIFQEPMTSLNPVLTVGYQISEIILEHQNVSKSEAKKKAIEMMKTVGIPDAENRYGYYPQQFSGGMRQRIMIAIALSSDPEILIADEATTALDVTTQAQILELLKELADKRGIAIIFVTHNLGVVARYAERIYVMYAGLIMETATTRDLFKHPQHPYARSLMRAIPKITDPKDRVLIPIDGLPPNLMFRKSYCPFYERCLYRMDKCKQGIPELTDVGPEHQKACFLTAEELEVKQAEIDAIPQRVAPTRNISEEKCLELIKVRKYFPVYKGFIKKKIAEVKAIDDISFFIRKGETVGLVGESGCGKTTLARCITRMYKPDQGEIIFNGDHIEALTDKQLKPYRPKIAMIYQDPFSTLDPRQLAGAVVGESLLINKLVKNKAEYERRIDQLFEVVGLDTTMKDRAPHEFSGGQRQRLGIARALASNPDLILCDEPISALDVSIQAQIINLLEDLQSTMGLSYLFIAHDLAVVKHISDRVVVMYLGNIVETATSEDLYNNPIHPYTKALLSAVPIPDPEADAGRERIKLVGEVPSVLERPAGCPFSNRCQYAMDRCRKENPTLIEYSNQHEVACWLYRNDMKETAAQ